MVRLQSFLIQMQRLFIALNILRSKCLQHWASPGAPTSPRNTFLWFSIAGVSVTWQILKSSADNICGTLTSDQRQKEGWPGQPGFYTELSGWVYPAMTEEVMFGALSRLTAHHSQFRRRKDGQGSTPAPDKPSSAACHPLTLGLAPQTP